MNQFEVGSIGLYLQPWPGADIQFLYSKALDSLQNSPISSSNILDNFHGAVSDLWQNYTVPLQLFLTDANNKKISLASLASSPRAAYLGGNVEFAVDNTVAITRPNSITIPIDFSDELVISHDQGEGFFDPADNSTFGNLILQKVHELNEAGADIYVSGHIRGGSFRVRLDSY